MTVYVLHWRYYDGSASGVSMVFQNAAFAEVIRALLTEEGVKDWRVDPLDVVMSARQETK